MRRINLIETLFDVISFIKWLTSHVFSRIRPIISVLIICMTECKFCASRFGAQRDEVHMHIVKCMSNVNLEFLGIL